MFNIKNLRLVKSPSTYFLREDDSEPKDGYVKDWVSYNTNYIACVNFTCTVISRKSNAIHSFYVAVKAQSVKMKALNKIKIV